MTVIFSPRGEGNLYGFFFFMIICVYFVILFQLMTCSIVFIFCFHLVIVVFVTLSDTFLSLSMYFIYFVAFIAYFKSVLDQLLYIKCMLKISFQEFILLRGWGWKKKVKKKVKQNSQERVNQYFRKYNYAILKELFDKLF